YTILRCTILGGSGPFKGALINGHILGPDGSRMSKSKGNVIIPEQGINQYGADAIRQALLSLTLGSDFPFKWEPVKYGKGFLQKVWSSARFVEGFFGAERYELRESSLDEADRWILSRLREVVPKVEEAYSTYQFHIAIDLLQKFYWHDFCDQYIEAVKPRLYTPPTEESQAAAKAVLYKVIYAFVRMLAPVCPHIAEEIYEKVCRAREGHISVHCAPWPTVDEVPEVDGSFGALLIKAISDLRSKKVEEKIALSAEVRGALISGTSAMIKVCRENEWLLRNVLHIDSLEFAIGDPKVELMR
ncbi:MAG: class I tRNA ligase family protein, partial [Candidatus Methanomethylicia archaeon]|nr:class I tRNA ligase family protein [Candidatus Methanomethylicia archaeon]